MSYDEQEARKSRVVVETPTTRREVTHTEAVRGDRDGVSGATVGVIVVVAIALVTILILFLMSGQSDIANDNLALQQQPAQPSTTIVQQPAAQQPPVIIQQAPPATQQAPIIVTQPAGDLLLRLQVDRTTPQFKRKSTSEFSTIRISRLWE